MNRLLTALLLCAPLSVFAAESEVHYRASMDYEPGAQVSFENLVGEVNIVNHDGNEIIIQVTVAANARQPNEAEALARSVTLQHQGKEFWMDFPTNEHSRFLYRTRDGRTNTNTSYRGRRVSVSNRGSGAEVHANVRISVPLGAKLSVNNVVGRVIADGTRADLSLRTGAGQVSATNTSGELGVNSGSGAVRVAGHAGRLEARTGSGQIRAERISGPGASFRTGSGSIRIEAVEGSLMISTGSGSVVVGESVGSTELSISTGSGSIRLDGNLADVTNLRMTTGSGSVNVNSSGIPNLTLEARAGSGSVSVNSEDMRATRVERNRVDAVLGTGAGEARITTGSGSIRFNAGQ